MANRFLKPQKANDTYHPVDHYIPLPFNEIAETLKQRQNNYDQNRAYQERAEDMFNQVGTRAVDTPAKNKIIQDYNNEIQDVVKNKYNNDWGAAGEELSDITRKYARNPFWKAAQGEYANAVENQKFLDEAKKNGKGVLHFNDRNEYNGTSVLDENGNVRDISHLRPDSRVQMDWSKAMGDATKLHANTFAGAARKGGVAGYLEQINSGGISDKQVRASLGDATNRLLSTQEGRQMLEYYTRRSGGDQDAALKQIQGELLSHGMQQVHSNTERKYIGDKEWDLNADLAKISLKEAAKKKEAIAGRAQMIPNTSTQGITMQDNAALYGTNKMTIPFYGQSNRTYNDFHNSYTPTGKMFVYGNGENRAKSGQPSDQPLKDATFVKTIVGYKIAGGKNAGAPLTKGVAGSGGDSADDNHIQKDEYGNMYIVNEDKERIPVQPQAYKLFTTKDGKTGMEEADRHESMRDLGGMNLSGQRFIEKSGSAHDGSRRAELRISNGELMHYLGIGPDQLDENSPTYNSKAAQKITQLARIERDGIKSKEDEQLVDEMENLLDHGYDQIAVQPGILNYKPELTPKSLLGTASEKDTENED